MSDTNYEISDSDWGDRAMYNLWQLEYDEAYDVTWSKLIARATIYYPKDPDYGWVMEFSGMGDRVKRGLFTERYYYDGSLHSARFAASKFVEQYKDSLEKTND